MIPIDANDDSGIPFISTLTLTRVQLTVAHLIFFSLSDEDGELPVYDFKVCL